MNINGPIQMGIFFAFLIILVKPLGLYMAKVYEGKATILDRPVRPIEKVIYRLLGVNPGEEMDWKNYAVSLLVFSIFSFLLVYMLLRLQGLLPFNPQKFGGTSPALAFNTAISFVTNTNWQNYGGETTLSYLTQMAALTVQNFVSAAAGMAVLIAFIRSLARHQTNKLGNFWVDLTRGTLYILLPMSIILALLLVSQGVVQTFSPYKPVILLQPINYQQQKLDASGNPVIDSNGQPVMEPVTQSTQLLAVGPAASQIAIKQLGTNGGGFFDANSAHPFENPTPFSNFLEMLSILLIPAALTYTFGKMVGSTRQGWAILAAMLIILLLFLAFTIWAEEAGNPVLANLGVDQGTNLTHPGGNIEGKELRFGQVPSDLFAVSTTAASNGAVNSMHDSYTPLGGMAPLLLIDLGEVVFGGVGSGLYGMVTFIIIATFVAGLMIGRTPEYLGKKLGASETRISIAVVLLPTLIIMVGTAIALLIPEGRSSIFNPGPHGFTEVLYAFSSAGNNNGSAFAGLAANTPFYNYSLGLAMLLGRFGTIMLILLLASSLAEKKTVPPSSGTLPTHTPLFILWLVGVVILVGALSFFTALALGPIVEHLSLYGGIL